MANLLINEEKKNLQQDLSRRKLVVVSFALTLLLLFLVIVLSAFWLSLVIRQEQGIGANSSPVANQKQDKLVSGPSDPISLLKKVGEQVKIVNHYWSEPIISEMVSKSLFIKPGGLRISSFTVERLLDEKKVNMSLSGTTPSRASLIAYVNSLRQENFFSTVDLPVESLISSEGGQFIINLGR